MTLLAGYIETLKIHSTSLSQYLDIPDYTYTFHVNNISNLAHAEHTYLLKIKEN